MRNPYFLSILLINLFLLEIAGVSGQCLNDQSSLLLQLKNSLHLKMSSASQKLNTWNPGTDCCVNWGGVKCDSSGRVTDLDLNSESITGGINSYSSLFSLKFLKSLNIAYNNFNFTPIPPDFNNLSSLTNLNLSNSYFGGQIPTELSQLTRLVVLDLSVFFGGKLFLKLENPNLTMFVQNLTELTELYLDGVKISAQGYDWGKAISSGLPNLRVLSLSNCNLSGSIDSSLRRLKFLSQIRLDRNSLSSPVPEFLVDFKNLTSLRLSSCNLTGEFPQIIFRLQTLKIVDLSVNGLLRGSLPEFPQNRLLQKLLLQATNFSGSLPNSIGNLRMLSTVDLSTGNFSGGIPSSISNLTKLTYLDLSSNMFSGSIPSFQMSSHLSYINLSKNRLSGQLSPQFEGLLHLQYIDLRLNSFTGKFPVALLSLPSLQNLQLSNNQIGGTLEEISTLPSSLLETLDLSSNKLKGEIPSSLFDLKALVILSLSSNSFSGTLKLENVWKLVNLSSLDLSHNNLSIETSGKNSSNLNSFPQLTSLKLASCKIKYFPDLKNQTRLFELDLSDNQISEEIPNWIWSGGGGLTYLNLSHNHLERIQEPYDIYNPTLSILDLHSNYLKGKMPTTPPMATYLDYSSNHFRSSIPFDIGNSLIYTIFFSVARNNLIGTIPDSICNATYLQVLDMSDNGLNGTIPLCLSEKIKTLVILNLGKNHLTGKFLGSFPKNCGLETLDLNGNHLEGKIPESLANCTSLDVLNLGENLINDTFPCFLNNSTNLRVLVLRSNMFHGEIRCPGVEENWQKLQIIDVSNNNFSGLLPLNNSKWEAMMEEPKLNYLDFEILQLSDLYYQNTVSVTNKGLEMELVKILTIFTAIDFSMNRFEGSIPDKIGDLKSLYVLNLSYNSLSNSIPSSLGILMNLESLDLSGNNLSGVIPQQLANLTFLAFLDLSYNQLTGRIPTSTQIQSFTESSFEGNKDLCGPPSAKRCGISNIPFSLTQKSDKSPAFDWQLMIIGIGFGVGFVLVLALLTFWKLGRDWLDEQTDKVVIMILPAFGLEYRKKDRIWGRRIRQR